MNELKNVFKFLKDYNEIRNPVILDIDEHSWHIDLEKLTENKEIFSVYRDENYEKLKILEVEKPHIKNDLSEAEKQALDFYNELYSLYSKINKEAESLELILSDGHISWNVDGKKINHPILLQKVKLEFDTNKPSFTLVCDELRTEVNTPLLRSIESINQSVLSESIKEIENNNVHIANKEENNKIFKELVNTINEEGLTITYSPKIYLRKRNLGFTEFIDKIIDDIEDKEDFKTHKFFENMIGNHSEYKTLTDEKNNKSLKNNVLLTMPANEEQAKIIEYLDDYGHVLVQGPPGTGKTHTIANLIGHLLSKGERVLVTSHTEKALTVLKEKVHEDLQSLCISLLSSSSERKQMDETLFEIAEKSTTLDLTISAEKIDQLEEERKQLLKENKFKNEELLNLRSLEYENIIYEGQAFKLSDAAKFVRAGCEKLDYIPGEIRDLNAKFSMSIEDLEFLYKTNKLISKHEETLIDTSDIELKNIWTPDKLEKINDELLEHENKLEGWTSSLQFKDAITKEELKELSDMSIKVKKDLEDMDDFQRFIINKSLKDEIYISFWQKIINSYNSLIKGYATYRTILFENTYDIPSSCYSSETIDILNEIIDRGKQIPVNFLTKISRPKWKKIYENIKKDGKALHDKQDYEDAKYVILYELNRKHILQSVNKLLENTPMVIDDGASSIENQIKAVIDKVKHSLRWHDDVWIRFKKGFSLYLKNIDYTKEENINNASDPVLYIDKLIKEKYIRDTSNTYNQLCAYEKIDQVECQIRFLKKCKNKNKKMSELSDAFKKKDIDSYEECYKRLVDLYNKKNIYRTRKELIEKLKTIAPTWADQVEDRSGVHGEEDLPKDIDLAWKWKVLNEKLKRQSNYDCNEIQDDINLLNKKIRNNAKKLSYEKAWFNKVKNNTLAQTQAIEGWKQTMKLIGKGTGKNAPMLREKARQLMTLSQTAIPVWIMPLNRVADSFDPQNNEFDTIIIDEASQADILALSVLYLGKKIIIVGDDEQVSPESIGISTDQVNALREQYLGNIPNEHLFDVRTSIYDMAKTSGFKSLMLTEHFRCLPEIVEFSNLLSYNGKIKSLRDASTVAMKPVINYRVPGGKRNLGKVNKIEAEHIVSLISSCVANPAYKDKTIGVITMVGQDQAQEIDKMLQASLTPEEYKNRRIQCGNSAQFQGDERDIIFISLVDGPKTGGGYIRLLSEDGNHDMNRKRYNVAASRAKDQLWVVHSLDPETDLNPLDIRKKLIDYAIDPKVSNNIENSEAFEYPLQTEIKKVLLKDGYHLHSNWKVGVYNIDMVIEYGNNKVALEFDGEKLYNKKELSKDLKRQNILERLGWKFIRIRASEYYKNPESTIKRLCDQLEENNIIAKDNNERNSKPKDLGEELLKEIMRQASLIRNPKMDIKYESEDASVLDDVADVTKLDLEHGYVNYDDVKEMLMKQDE